METNYQFRHTYDLYNYIMNILASKEKENDSQNLLWDILCIQMTMHYSDYING